MFGEIINKYKQRFNEIKSKYAIPEAPTVDPALRTALKGKNFSDKQIDSRFGMETALPGSDTNNTSPVGFTTPKPGTTPEGLVNKVDIKDGSLGRSQVITEDQYARERGQAPTPEKPINPPKIVATQSPVSNPKVVTPPENNRKVEEKPHTPELVRINKRIEEDGRWPDLVRSNSTENVSPRLLSALLMTENRGTLNPEEVAGKPYNYDMGLVQHNTSQFGTEEEVEAFKQIPPEERNYTQSQEQINKLFKEEYGRNYDVFDPVDNIKGTVVYLKWLMDTTSGSLRDVIGSYNKGRDGHREEPNEDYIDTFMYYYNEGNNLSLNIDGGGRDIAKSTPGQVTPTGTELRGEGIEGGIDNALAKYKDRMTDDSVPGIAINPKTGAIVTQVGDEKPQSLDVTGAATIGNPIKKGKGIIAGAKSLLSKGKSITDDIAKAKASGKSFDEFSKENFKPDFNNLPPDITIKLSDPKLKIPSRNGIKRFGKEELLDDIIRDIKKGDKMPPIRISLDRNGNFIIKDGNTRATAFKELGIKEIPAYYDRVALKQLWDGGN